LIHAEACFFDSREGAEARRLQDLEALASAVVDDAFRIRRELGPGLLESVYEMILVGKLAQRGIEVARQVPVSVEYDGLHFEAAFRIDLLVGGRLLVEIKSVERLNGAHAKQLLTYLRLTKQPLGLLINFGGETLKEGLRRVVNDYKPFAP
jgi:iron complex transport system substrate-binding protein